MADHINSNHFKGFTTHLHCCAETDRVTQTYVFKCESVFNNEAYNALGITGHVTEDTRNPFTGVSDFTESNPTGL